MLIAQQAGVELCRGWLVVGINALVLYLWTYSLPAASHAGVQSLPCATAISAQAEAGARQRQRLLFGLSREDRSVESSLRARGTCSHATWCKDSQPMAPSASPCFALSHTTGAPARPGSRVAHRGRRARQHASTPAGQHSTVQVQYKHSKRVRRGCCSADVLRDQFPSSLHPRPWQPPATLKLQQPLAVARLPLSFHTHTSARTLIQSSLPLPNLFPRHRAFFFQYAFVIHTASLLPVASPPFPPATHTRRKHVRRC